MGLLSVAVRTVAKQKASGGDHGNQYTGGKSEGAPTFGKTKEEIIKGLGFSKYQIGQFEKLAANPDAVEQAKQEAIRDGKPATRARATEARGNQYTGKMVVWGDQHNQKQPRLKGINIQKNG